MNPKIRLRPSTFSMVAAFALLSACGDSSTQSNDGSPDAANAIGDSGVAETSADGAAPLDDGAPPPPQSLPVQKGISAYADTRRGSASNAKFSHGNTFPAVAVPFGFNLWTPITDGDSGGVLYEYAASTLQGFGLSHEPSPWMGDYGSIQLWPMTGDLKTDPAARAQGFRHASETAKAYSYSVDLASGIHVEIAPTDHAASFRFTYPEAAQSYLLFDAIKSMTGTLTVDGGAGTVSGFTDGNGQRIYIHAAVLKKGIASTGPASGRPAGAWLEFATKAKEEIVVNVGTSWLSVEQAKANLDAEIGSKSWSRVRDEAADAWDRAFSRVAIEGATDDQKTIFYSNLYRAYLYPTSRWESVDGNPTYLSPYDHKTHTGKMWVNNGFWDTYRSEFPWLFVMRPEASGEMLDGFVAAYREGGWTPRWSAPGYANLMTGTHTDVVFADAYTKGIRNFDIPNAYASAVKNATVYSPDPSQGRKGIERTPFVGYTPADAIGESGAWHLEGCVNDFGISQLASALGKKDEATYFMSRALSYVHSFSPSVGFFRGRNADGNWRTSDADFSPFNWWQEFTEGDAWQYAFSAPFDARGVANLYGGRAAYVAKLDGLFSAPRTTGGVHEQAEAFAVNMGQYDHSNETVHHVIYMYNYAGVPSKTQEHVRAVLDPKNGLYTVGADGTGWLGDEDNGQMSAWFLFSALGLYPATGGHAEYLIGSPLYPRVTISPEGGKLFTIRADGNSDDHRYVQSASLNGKPYSKSYITHADLIAGGELVVVMGASPSAWGTGNDDVPTSVTTTDAVAKPLEDAAHGGLVVASSDNGPGEAKEMAFDDSSLTKWLAKAQSASIQYTFAPASHHTVVMYTLTSGDDLPARDPVRWTLEGPMTAVKPGRCSIVDPTKRSRSGVKRVLSRFRRPPKSEWFDCSSKTRAEMITFSSPKSNFSSHRSSALQNLPLVFFHGHAHCSSPVGVIALARARVLVRVLPEWKLRNGGVYLVYPATRHLSPETRALVDFLRARAAVAL